MKMIPTLNIQFQPKQLFQRTTQLPVNTTIKDRHPLAMYLSEISIQDFIYFNVVV